MDDPELQGKRVLIVEDEPLIAMMIEEQLADIGCVVVGPFERLQLGLAAARGEPVDFALLDVNVAGEKVFPIAEELDQRGVPFLFLTGYGDGALAPDRPHWEALSKPFRAEQLADRLAVKMKQSNIKGLASSR
jgi:DNA-binding response OmpR family regulator